MHKFTLNDVIALCGERAFIKGKECDSDDYRKLFRRANVLSGLYVGSVGVYKVSLIFDKGKKPSYIWCTCPSMGVYDDTCKHVAGLLIHWVQARSRFKILSSWEDSLSTKTKTELIDVIRLVAAKSIDTANELHTELFNEPLFEEEDLYDGDDEW